MPLNKETMTNQNKQIKTNIIKYQYTTRDGMVSYR